MVRLCPVPPRMTSWWATSPARRTEWMRTPAGPAPPRLPSSTSGHGGVGSECPRAGIRAGRGHAPRRHQCGARRRVKLAVVVELDDFGPTEVRRGHLGKAHHQDGPDGEVRRHDAVRRARSGAGKAPGQVRVVLLGQAGRAHDRMDPGFGAVGQGEAGGIDAGEVHHHLDTQVGQHLETTRDGQPAGVGADHSTEVGTPDCGVHGGHQLEVGMAEHGPAHLPAHLPPGSDDPDSHAGHPTVATTGIPGGWSLRAGRSEPTGPEPGHLGESTQAERSSIEVGLVERSHHRQRPRGGHQLGRGVMDLVQGQCGHPVQHLVHGQDFAV